MHLSTQRPKDLWTKLTACCVARKSCVGMRPEFDLSRCIAKQQGSTMPNGLIKRHTFVLNHKANDFRGKGPLPHTNRLFVCEERDPPNYKNNSGNITRFPTLIIVKLLCEITVDLRDLPQKAFELRYGEKGQFYQTKYDLGLTFGAELVFTFLYNEKVLGRASTRYL